MENLRISAEEILQIQRIGDRINKIAANVRKNCVDNHDFLMSIWGKDCVEKENLYYHEILNILRNCGYEPLLHTKAQTIRLIRAILSTKI